MIKYATLMSRKKKNDATSRFYVLARVYASQFSGRNDFQTI